MTMVDMLDKNNKHLFLEKVDNNTNSFIANVNLLASKVGDLLDLNTKLSQEQIDILTQLAGIGADTLAEDLEKGSASGYRKLDIDLLKNFANYNRTMTDEQKRNLWSNVSAQVYYESATVMFKDKTSIFKMFTTNGVETPVSNHHKLYDQFNNWPEFKAKYGYTFFDISPDTALLYHELLRFTDGQGNGSTIDYIVLHVAGQGKNLSYDAAFQGAKEHDPKYTWVDTTSVLLTICNDLSSLLNIAGSVDDLRLIYKYLADLTKLAGSLPVLIDNSDSLYNSLSELQKVSDNMGAILEAAEYVGSITEAQAKLDAVSKQVAEDKTTTETLANRVQTLSDELKNLQAKATTLTPDQDATAEYDAITGQLTIGVPRGLQGTKGNDGQDGRDGRDGIDGRDGTSPDHRWVGTSLQFRNPDGTWGPATDLYRDSEDVLKIADAAKKQVAIMERLIQEADNMKFIDDYGYITEEVEETFDYGHLTD